MKFFTIFIACFAVLSLLPFFWHSLEFVEIGYPFSFSIKTEMSGALGSAMSVSFVPINLFYDLLVAFLVSSVVVFVKHYANKARKNEVKD